MRLSNVTVTLAALSILAAAPHANASAYDIANGTLQDGGIFTGSFDYAADAITNATITVDDPSEGIDTTFSVDNYGNNYGDYTESDESDGNYDGETFVLDVSNLNPGTVCTSPSVAAADCGGVTSFLEVSLGDQYTLYIDATDPPTAATPEPSSSVLVVTGMTALAGTLRRRFIKA